MVISGKSAFFWGVESIRLSCRRGRCFAAGPVGCQGSAYLYFFSQMRTICQDTGGFARSPHFHLFNKQALFQGWGLLCVSFLGQDSVYVLTALPTELHRPRADDGIRTHDKLIYIMRLLLEPLRGVGHPAAFAARVGLRVGGMTRRIQDAGALRLLAAYRFKIRCTFHLLAVCVFPPPGGGMAQAKPRHLCAALMYLSYVHMAQTLWGS